MYLKRLEIIGFKSFADKTRLEFEPGMTSIVGPNGCGKSNVSDAIRWVLGEQSAKALRGGKMEDVIFNGTDNSKPLGMAEVSLTLADCEATLGMEYNEVTVTRRVFRSGEGQYFINKAPCRLKDIQRLFMDTGVGTNSYSIMEQGKIDRILSSHPEDRRAVFEEASGITKFKADKKEALRKLDQTEANLLRLDDIIREVKRQIISLQRQAGKARRYQELRDEVRGIELFHTRERLTALDADIKALEARLAAIREQDEAVRHDIEQEEQVATQLREQLDAIDLEINQLMEQGMQSKSELNRLRDLIRTNEERVVELQQLSERDSRDAGEAKARLEQHIATRTEEQQKHATVTSQRDAMEKELAESVQRLQRDEKAVQDTNRQSNQLRSEQIDVESRQARLQNELTEIDAEERKNDIRRERLSAELGESTRASETFKTRQAEMTAQLASLQSAVEEATRGLETAKNAKADQAGAIATSRTELNKLQPQAAAIDAKINLLAASQKDQEGFPEGARRILSRDAALPYKPEDVLGPLADLVRAENGYERALETVMRPLLDSIVVRHDETIAYFVREIERHGFGSVRLVSLRGPDAETTVPAGADRLIDHVRCADEVKPLLARLFGNVIVVESGDQLPQTPDPRLIALSRNGALAAAGHGEFWNPKNQATTPLARSHMLAAWKEESASIKQNIARVQQQLAALQKEEVNFDRAIEERRTALDQSRRQLNLAQGESQVVIQQAKQMAQRVETISFELQALQSSNSNSDERRARIQGQLDQYRDRLAEIRTGIATQTNTLRDLEQARLNSQTETTERRVRFSELKQTADHTASRIDQLGARIRELESLIDERTRGVNSYQERMGNLNGGIAGAKKQIEPVELAIAENAAAIETARTRKDAAHKEFSAREHALRQKRQQLEDIHKRQSQGDIELAQQRMRKQNLVERVTGEYKITAEDVYQAAEPAWENGERPAAEIVEARIAEMHAKIEAMGPVNLVAIEEHAELEERYAFLTAQQTDLVNAKTQLVDMIRQINATTTELFSKTFNQVNENFMKMFTQMFGGGSAKLVLVDEGDVLESGIEIIARPPGKKLQTVSLLSGGERTMTAVALLFSLYMVKPSPFCVLDELDAALDDANIGRFVKTVRGFIDKSQFVVITHNRQTIAASRAIYGVTMEKQGISKIISVKFSDYEKEAPPSPAPAAGSEAPQEEKAEAT
ncbi:MAG TPA: chromosome segregation protein SMC [Kiritimatiellia bacterium]|nr:chromosome segregation protein SMC [Kiritimatiellia bacterium]HMP35213.1 chromosome segregation protein SMC [Kiritimatiellia bacterium]